MTRKNEIMKRSSDGTICSKELKEIFEAKSSAALNYHVKKLLEEGFLKELLVAEGKTKIYWINSHEDPCTGARNIEEDKGSFDNFDNLQLILSEKGYVLPISEIAKTLGMKKNTIIKIISRNERLFASLKTIQIIQGNEATCLTRDGIIALLMRVSLDRLPEEKQEKVLSFQKWAVEKLGQLMVYGKVQMHPKEQKQIRADFEEILEKKNRKIQCLQEETDKLRQAKRSFDEVIAEKVHLRNIVMQYRLEAKK